ncbi:hypothetical protein ACFW91_02375 [Streptomyces asoensis]|uniref:hypothetical protein n=1 Tax=Streptomyces TaxID=1883 RepID=UPI001F3A647A|nr:hypothetical protein [Streptomyces sp. MBT49]
MTDHHGHPQQPQPPEQSGARAWEIPQQVPPVQQVPVPAPVAASAPQTAPVPQAPQVFQAEHAWVDGYEPGNPWQASLCVKTPYGTFAYPLTPNTIPELLEQMVLVAQEQQGMPVGFDEEPQAPVADAESVEEDEQSLTARLQGGRAARLSGWSVVHELWEREDPTARIVMGAIVVALLLLGIVLT